VKPQFYIEKNDKRNIFFVNFIRFPLFGTGNLAVAGEIGEFVAPMFAAPMFAAAMFAAAMFVAAMFVAPVVV
jgi:hypothetical protein